MKKQICFLFLVFHIVIYSNQSFANADSAAIKAKHLIEELRSVNGVPGLSISAGRNGEIIWSEGFGSRDLENGVSATSDTIFRIGSVSKVFTVAALARLYDQGKINLDAEIGTYIKYIPEEYKKLTCRQLAGHLAGVRHYLNKDFDNDVKHFNSVKESTQIFTGDPLLHPPGTKYLYSTFGYVLLSAALEEASGKEFLKLLQDEVLAPLNLKHSSVDQFREIIPKRTRYYSRINGEIKHASFEDPSYKWAAGGIISTAEDLVKFGMAHLKPGYLKSETLRELFTSQATSDGKETGVGIGWRTGEDWAGRKVYHHAGNISGGRAVLVLYPEENFAIAITTNLSSEPPLIERTAEMIADLFISSQSSPPPGDITGTFAVTGQDKEKPFSAELKILRTNNEFTGSITGDFPLISIAKKNEWPTQITVADVFQKEKSIVVVLASAFGLIDLRLSPQDNGYSFLIDVGPSKIVGTMLKQ